ncbi:2-oxo-4-hydroxy-4-carboxy-5-ureidoimidazoline decarboxylase [Streptomyces avicenniae]|uniref:2-oxo-4-hydroxy-4-carboxy-5-ureidoimidazoline decarboxylase n=1 Tax=Streptomyces avicenniae TaxID=500153 RepID=UPI000AF643EC|nr:2-oxo-4-hydroxy-4-carboxy-5-ureidoimidazoline decarboxylase [Streptomyces avicenniae]
MTSRPPHTPPPGLAWLNGAEDRAVRPVLRRLCAAPDWADRLLAARPYADTAALLAVNDAAVAALSGDGLDAAVAGHPRIGRPDPADPASAREQRGMADADAALRAEMTELNLAYQERFGHVFLIRATGLTAVQLRDALRARLGNDPAAERAVTRTELGRINALRLTRLAESTATVSTHVLDTGLGRPASGVPVTLAVRLGREGPWTPHATARTDADGRCGGLPDLPGAADTARLTFAVDTPFFPEATVTFRVVPGEHHHVPLLLSPYGHSVYRGS